jgi:hypothetical protein
MEHETERETYTHSDGSKVSNKYVTTGGEVGRHVDLAVTQTHHAKDGSPLQVVNHYYKTPVLHGGHTGPQQHAGSYRQYIDPQSRTWQTATYTAGHDQRADADAKSHLENNHRGQFSWPEDAP